MKIKRVNSNSPGIRMLLEVLHLDCFPSDEFPDFSHGWWWIAYDDEDNAVGLLVYTLLSNGTKLATYVESVSWSQREARGYRKP